jgi:PBSX family phage portal protein
MAAKTKKSLAKTLSPEQTNNVAELTGLKVSKVTVIKSDDEGPDTSTQAGLLRSQALTMEDDPWQKIQFSNKFDTIAPTYEPVRLALISWENNTLRQCISAFKTNVDGTGATVERKDDKITEDEDGDEDPEIDRIEAFFDTPYPGLSFHTMREKLRDDVKTTGNAYLEVIRDQGGKIALLNVMDAKLTRLIRHDDKPVAITEELNRTGQEGAGQTVTYLKYERRYVQIIGLAVRFFKEYKATRQLDAITGQWIDKPAGGTQAPELPPIRNATEVIHFRDEDDVLTPYGAPQWINQIPSVIGSRKAEELNLEFFNHGGVPPVIIMIQGGTLNSKARTELTNYLGGAAKYKQRGVVLEIAPSGGDLNSANNVKATVEKFGDVNKGDSMFEKYDDKCTQRIRSCFRLPPLLIGLAQDYNYATAQTAILMAEEQVFAPERRKFDEVINSTLMKELDPTGEYVYKSKAMTAKFLDEQLQALGIVKDMVDGQGLITAVNTMVGLDLKFDAKNAALANGQAQMQQEGVAQHAQNFAQQTANGGGGPSTGAARTGGGFGSGKAGGAGKSGGVSPGQKGNPAKNAKVVPIKGKQVLAKSEDRLHVHVTKGGFIRKMDPDLLINLSSDWSSYLNGDREFTRSEVRAMTTLMESMTPGLKRLFADNVAKSVVGAGHDPDGVRDLISCAGDLLSKTGDVQLIAQDPQPIYLDRPVTNAAAIIAWAKGQGFQTTVQAHDMHVTIAHSQDSVHWKSVSPSTDTLEIKNGLRVVAPLGVKGAVVLLISSPELQQRFEQLSKMGATSDFPSYVPHITLTYEPGDLDLAKVVPYQGVIELGAERIADPNLDKMHRSAMDEK